MFSDASILIRPDPHFRLGQEKVFAWSQWRKFFGWLHRKKPERQSRVQQLDFYDAIADRPHYSPKFAAYMDAFGTV